MCFLLSSVLFAGPVSKQQAQETASRFMTGKTHRAPSTAAMQTQVVLNAVDNVGQPLLYAVTMGSEQGFVLVSGDDRFRSVLGYSDSGSFDAAAMPENMKSWLQGYVEEMKHLDAIGYQPSASTSRRAGGLKAPIAPLIQTIWGQSEPYNNACPVFFDGERSVTGCVATAMAQVMYYTATVSGNKPQEVVADIPGYDCDTYWSGYGRLNVGGVFAGTSLDWDAMADVTTAEGAAAVATLMMCCGKSVEMDYSSNESGADSEMVPVALKKYFGYDSTTRYVSRSSYSLAEWTELIYSELEAARPVIYGGQSSGGGHEFVVDGYDGDEMFHVNWGWSGSSDSYFALSVMNPGDNSGIGASTSNDGYSYNQDATIGIQIGSDETYTEQKFLNFAKISIDGTTINYSVFNHNHEALTFDYGLAFIDGDGKVSAVIAKSSGKPFDAPSGGSYPGYGAAVTIPGSLSAGTYKIGFVSKESAASEWVIHAPEYVEAVSDGAGNVTLTLRPTVILEATAINFTGTKYKDEAQPVEVTVQNNGEEFYGQLYLFANTISSDKGSKPVNKGGVTVLAGKTGALTFEWTPTTTGTYYVWVTTDEAGTNVIGTGSVVITESPADASLDGKTIAVIACQYENQDEGSLTENASGVRSIDVIDNSVSVTAVVKNLSSSDYNHYVGLQIVNESDYPVSNITYIPSLGAGKTYTFEKEATGLEPGKYIVQVISFDIVEGYAVNMTVLDDRYTCRLVSSYLTIDKNGQSKRVKATGKAVTVADDVAAIDLMDFDYTSIAPNSNPNTLYYISSSQDASSLAGLNVVVDGQIANLTLTDGNAFYVPVSFLAEQVTYKRTFSNYYSGGLGWSTIVLPFDAVVSNDAGQLTWYDPDRRFWLMEFSGDAGSTVNFTHADGDKMKANVPYIIALPGAAYGEYSLVGKNTLTFTGENVAFTANAKAARTGSNYKFIGTTTFTGTKEMYKLNANGNAFEKGSAVEEEPFRAYFTGTSLTSTGSRLSIGFENNEATGISLTPAISQAEGEQRIYNLNGQRVGHPAKGLYIVNGKKVVIK